MMVNYRRLVCEVALLGALVAFASTAPTPDCTHDIHYDQRQNGSENYRLNIDGLVFAVAPAEGLFSALGDMDDIMELLALEDLDYKPKPPQSSSPSSAIEIISVGNKPQPAKPLENKPSEDKPSEEKPSQEKPSQVNSSEEKPEQKPLGEKPQQQNSEVPVKSAPLSDVSLSDDDNIQRKEVSMKKQEKTKRLKNRLASFLLPLLRKTRHH